MPAGQIDIFGKFHASTAEGILAVTSEIKDEHFNKTQAELNLEFSENHGGVSSVAGLTGDVLAADLLEALNLDDVVSNVSVLMQRTNWDNYFGIDQQTGAIFVKPIDANTPRGFYSLGYISAGGVGSSGGGGGGGADLLDVWVSLRDNNPGEDFYNWKINPGHIPGLPWSQITSGKPTTLSGYGITDAYTKTQVDNLIGAIDLTPYLLASVAAQTYATITSLEAVSARVSVLEGRTNWDDYLGIDADGNIYVKMNGQNARGFYSDGFIAAGGVGSSGGGGGEGASLLVVWRSLTNNNSLVDADITSTLKIAAAHIPDVASVYGYLKHNETITLTGVVTGSGTTTIATSIADGAIALSKISGLGAAATYGIGSVESGDNGLVTGGAVYSAIASAVAAEAELRLAADNALSVRIAVFEGMFEIVDGNIHVKNNRGFYSDSFISAGGVGSSSGGSGGADLLDMWVSLRDNTPNEDFYNWKVNAGHLPLGSGLTVDANGNINVGTAGSVAWTNVTGKPTTVSGYGITDAVTSASYNSTTKRIELKCGNVVISYIDATAFIKDGMVSNVQVTGGYLVISFNTDAGQEDIRIPISDIFNADNYYDKTASDARFFLAANFTAANIVSTIGNTPVARASRLDGDTALSIWGVEYWANGVPKAVSARPGLYIAGTQVNTTANKDTLLGVTAISNGLSSGSSDESRVEWDATNHAWHFYGGIYADTFVTAGGTNASGGGGDVDLDRVWESLTNNIDFPNVKINIAHIPALAISDITGLQTALDAKQDTISDLATIRARADEGHVAYGGLPTISDCLLSLQSQLDSVASRDNFDELTATAFYSDVVAVSSLYAETMSIGGADLSSTLSSLASRASDLETRASSLETRATNLEVRASTLERYFTNGSANSALRLTTVSKTAWGQTYWTLSGIPDSVSGNMSDVGNISMNGSISGATTITASGLVKTTNYMQAARFYLSDSVYFVLDANGVKLEGAGFYTDSFITAGGAGSSGGGGGDVDLDRVWESLTNNIDFPNTKINTAHIPDTASIYGYLKGNQTITLTGVVTGSGTTSIATSIADGALSIAKVAGLQNDLNTAAALLQSLQAQIDSVAARDMFDELSATVACFDTVVASSASISAITGELSGNAATASYLVSSSYGVGSGLNPIYFSGGRPQASSSTAGSASVPVYLDGGTLTAITPSSLFSNLSSGAATNLSVTIAGQNRTATIYATYDSAGENISSCFSTVSTALRSLQSQIDSVASRNGFDELTVTDLYSDMLSVGANATIGGPLVVRGTAKIADDVTLDNRLTVYDDAFFHSDIYLYAGMALYLDQGGNNALYYDASEGTIRFTFDYASHFTSGVYSDSFITAGGVNASSDARLKDNLSAISAEKALSVLMRLRPMEWVWNEKNAYLEGNIGAGLVAQEVESVLPFAVSSDTEYLSLNYNVFHAYEIAGLQDHERRIKALERENAELRRKLELINP